MKTLYYDYDAERRISSAGVAQTTAQKITYQSADRWALGIRHNAAGKLTPVDLSAATAWRAAVKVDYKRTTTVCCRVLAADIDASGAAAGDIAFILDANTATFLAAVVDVPSKVGYFELAGLDASGHQVFYFCFSAELVNTLDPSGGDPPEPAGNYYDKSEVTALVNGLAAQVAALQAALAAQSALLRVGGVTYAVAAVEDAGGVTLQAQPQQ